MEQTLLITLGLAALAAILILATAAVAVALLTFVFASYDHVPLDEDSQN